MIRKTHGRWVAALVAIVAGCDGSDISSDEEAELAYVGLDQAVERAMRLGLKGFSEASNANIADQEEDGDVGGTMIVGGQVDQGASNNKTMNLLVTLDDYQDVVDLDEDEDVELEVVYDTPDGAPATLDLKLAGIPDGTFTGTFAGSFLMIGDLEGEVTLNLALAGELEPDPAIEGGTRRVEGSTTVVGTATSHEPDGDEDGVYEVDLTI